MRIISMSLQLSARNSKLSAPPEPPMDILIPAEKIRERLDEMARDIMRFYDGRPVTVVGILNGCLMFVADLVRRIDLPLRVAFITASSYRGSATTPGRLEVRDELLPDLTDRQVLLLDDILDSGKTLTRVIAHLINRGAASVKVGVLLRKIGRQEVPFEPDFVGFTIPDKFVIGYGLDFNDEYRHLPYIGVLSDAQLA
jgi:hypoxanthine phosphoribosyltransferase